MNASNPAIGRHPTPDPDSAVLAGVRVLSFEQYGAGPFGTQYLADLGAEVIKVEQPGSSGDYVRELGPFYLSGERHSASSLMFQAMNRNKKSVCVDIRTEAGRQVLGRLVASADAVSNNLRGDVPAKLGITYDALCGFNPRIVAAHCSAYGRTGPRKDWPGFDFLMQAETGYFQMCGEPDTPPTRVGLSVVDYMAGLSMSLGLVSAILHARSSGLGRDVDVTLFDTALFNLCYLGVWALNDDYEPTRVSRSAHPTVVPCQLYKTGDGWIYLMCNKEHFWPTLCQLIDRKQWLDDPKFQTIANRLTRRDELTDLIDAALAGRTTEQWMQVFQGSVPAAPVLTPSEALRNPFVTDFHRIQTVHDHNGAAFGTLNQPVQADPPGSQITDRRYRPAPQLGEHTRPVMAELGYSSGEIAALQRDGVIAG